MSSYYGASAEVNALLNSIRTQRSSRMNRRQMMVVSDRCQQLVQLVYGRITAGGGLHSAGPDQTRIYEAVIQQTVQTLQIIDSKIQDWTRIKNPLNKLLLANQLPDDCHAEIEKCLVNLGLSGQFPDAALSSSAGTPSDRSLGMNEDYHETVAHIEEVLDYNTDAESIRQLQAQTDQFSRHAVGVMGMIQDALPRFHQVDQNPQLPLPSNQIPYPQIQAPSQTPSLSQSSIRSTRSTLQKNFMALKSLSGELPPRIELHKTEVRRVGHFPVAMGVQFDIWEGSFMEQEKVALKVLRGVQINNNSTSPNQIRRFHREATIWRQVWERDRGVHFLPYYGTVTDDGPYPYMVSPWQRNGTCLGYLKKYPHLDRTSMIKHLAKGLAILHTWQPNPIVHGDLKCDNILINDEGQPIIADFGLSKILENVTDTPFTLSKGIDNSFRWFAPEVCRDAVLSPQSDMFSFAITVIEMITCEVPYSEVKRTTEVMIRVQDQGLRPARPSRAYKDRGLTTHLWNLLELCWPQNPDQRLTISQFLERF